MISYITVCMYIPDFGLYAVCQVFPPEWRAISPHLLDFCRCESELFNPHRPICQRVTLAYITCASQTLTFIINNLLFLLKQFCILFILLTKGDRLTEAWEFEPLLFYESQDKCSSNLTGYILMTLHCTS